MTFPQRATLAWKALTGRFDLKPGSTGLQMLSGILPGAVGLPPSRGTQAQLVGYGSMPWVRAVASRIGHAVASAPWRLYAVKRGGEKAQWRTDIQRATGKVRKDLLHDVYDQGELTEIKDHPFLQMLTDGNAVMNGFTLRKLAQIHRDLVGETFFHKERGIGKIPVGLWLLSPTCVISTPTPSNQAYKLSYRAWQADIPATEICWMKDPDPATPYGRGLGTAQSLADEIELDEYAAKYLKQFFYNGARPDVLVAPKDGSIGAPELARLEQHWQDQHQGFWRSFKAMFSSRPLDVTAFPTNFEHLQMNQLRLATRDICLQVWGVPPEILGVIENSNRATIDASDYLFSKWVVEPRLEEWRLDYQRLLLPEYDSRLILDFESPVEGDKTFELEAMQAAPWAYDADEWRALAGHPPIEKDLGKWHMEPNTLHRVEDWEQPPAPVAPLTGPGLPADGAPGAAGVPGMNGNAPAKPLPAPFAARSLSDEQLLAMLEAPE